MSLQNDLSRLIDDKKASGLYRQRETLESAQGTLISIDGKEYLSFCSNDYLGLASDPELIAALQQGADNWGVGSGAAHLITGHSKVHEELEQALASHVGHSAALLFSTGYMANLALLTALCQKGDSIFEDRLNHASLVDGGLFSSATMKRYQHNDMQQLASLLASNEGRKFIVTDGVFSMDGDIAPLPDIMDLANQHQATVIVDDAHGLGVLGEHGAGICELYNLQQDDAPIIMGTLGKAVGVFGAFVAGSKILIDYLVQTARPYIYTTATPPALAAATLCSIEKIRKEQWRRDKLEELIQQFREACNALELELMPSQTPIQALVLHEEQRALAWSDALKARGILVKAIRPPTVPKGTARLRITFSATHSKEDVTRLVKALGELR